MELVRNNNLIVNNSKSITRTKPLKFDIAMSLLYTVLIMVGVFNSIGAVAAFVLIVLVFYTLPLENIVAQMIFLMSFANIFKMSVSSTSLFTIIELYVVVLMLWRRPTFKAKELLVLVLLVVSVLLGVLFSSNLQVLLSIKFIAAMLLVMGFKNTDYKKELPNYIAMLIIGLIISSFIAYFGRDIPQILAYMRTEKLVGSGWQGHYYTDTVRFCGLSTDPNYYCINLYMGIVGALVLDNKGVFKKRFWVYLGIVALFFFGIQTVSKSFALMAAVVVVYLLILSIKNKKIGLALSLCILIFMFVILAFSQKVETINTLVNRVVESLDGDNLTTGRTDIWNKYFSYLSSNPELVPFGAGFGYGYEGLVAAHNTYLESVTSLGVVGTILLLIFLVILFSGKELKIKRKLENYSMIMIVVIMYFFLSMLTWVDFPIHLFICYCFLNYSFGEK